MGMQTQGANKGRSRRRPMSEINVTPFVDVMLVLLIVFMVTAPLLTVGVPVELPQTQAEQITDDQTPLIITIGKEGQIALQNRVIAPELLIPRLEAIAKRKPETHIFVRGDKDLAYGEVITLMAEVKAAGFNRVALITKLPEGQ